VIEVGHSSGDQRLGVDHGEMDGFSLIGQCVAATGYACYQQYQLDQVPETVSLARTFALSDRTFEMNTVPSWGAHLELAAAQLDRFVGDNPYVVPGNPTGRGWGCDSYRDATWVSPTGPTIGVPACVPAPDGSGPYRSSPVSWVPTVMDRMDAAGLTWRLYYGRGAYQWAICPTFAECLNGPQAGNAIPSTDQFIADAQAGSLPNLAVILPGVTNSQHNDFSMLAGDNFIASVANAVMSGPEWSSTAMFITWDDCGCFYDHVPPPTRLGLRVPMIIVSPFAKPGYTDSNVASFASMLAYTERSFLLAPLARADAIAYAFSQSFDYMQPPLAPVVLSQHPVPAWELRWMQAHPADPDDPT